MITPKVLISVALAVAAAAAQSPQPTDDEHETVSISGVVRDADTGAAVSGAYVFTRVFGLRDEMGVETDAEGRYMLSGVPPGRTNIACHSRNAVTLIVDKWVDLYAGRDLGAVDFRVRALGSISGTVRDDNGDPVPQALVYLVSNEYLLGGSRYFLRSTRLANDQGEYTFQLVDPARGYRILAWGRRVPDLPTIDMPDKLDANSRAPADPKLRKPVLAPTYYPNSRGVAGAEPVVLRSGENRARVDIRMVRAPSYCIEGRVSGTAGAPEINVRIAAGEFLSDFYHPIEASVKAGGGIRVCDLPPGDYVLETYERASPRGPVLSFGSTPFAITDRDLDGLHAQALPAIPISAEWVWDGPPADRAGETNPGASLSLLSRTPISRENRSLGMCSMASMPCKFSNPSVPPGSYRVLAGETNPLGMKRVSLLPRGVYVKEITYGSASLLHAPLRVGSAPSEWPIHIVLAHDGGAVQAKVSDSDNPVPDVSVYVMPASAGSEAALADVLVSCTTGQDGTCLSASLPPGKYFALATAAELDTSQESIRKLWYARSQAKEFEVAPSQTAQITLELKTLE